MQIYETLPACECSQSKGLAFPIIDGDDTVAIVAIVGGIWES